MPQAPRILPAVWEAHRPRITELYVNQDKTLDEVIQIMAESGFHATKAQYIRKVNVNWKLQKNYTKEKWQHASALVTKREAEGKITQLSIDGKVISEKRRKKELGRYHTSQVDEDFVSTSTHGVVAFTPPSSNPRVVLINGLPWLKFQESFDNLNTTYELLRVAVSSGFLLKMKHILTTKGPSVKIFSRHLLFVAFSVEGSKGIKSIRFLLGSGVSPDSTDPNEYRCSALQKAVIVRNRDAVQLLLQFGANPNGKIEGTEDNTLESPLNYALCWGGDREIAKMLIEAGADVNSGFEKPLIQAARKGDSVLVRDMLEAGADLKMLPAEGLSVLYFAIEHQELGLVTKLIEAGVNPNLLIDEFRDDDIRYMVHELAAYGETRILTPLHYAVLSGDVDIVKRLIKYGAILDRFIDPATLKKMGQTLPNFGILTPLQMSIQEMKEEITKVLLDAGASVDFRHSTTGTALQLVCNSPMEERRKIELTKVLLAKGADINSLPGEPAGRTAMQAAAQSGNHDLLKLLWTRGGNPFASAAKKSGLTVFQAALKSSSVELVTYAFWELGISCRCFSFFNGTNYLQGAVSTGNIQLLETVLKFWNRHGLHWPKEFISSALKTAVRSGFIYHILGPGAESSTIRLMAVPEEDVSSLICESIWNVGTAITRTWTLDSGETVSAWARDTRVFDLLMQRFINPNLDCAQPGYPTPLWLAMHEGEGYMAERLLNAGANPNKPSPVVCLNCGNSYSECFHDTGPEMPLKQAICRFDSRFIELLTDKGANIDCLVDGSFTPLLVSLERKNESAAVFLLSKGADPNVLDISGRHTALGLALEQVVSLPTVQLLIQHGADVNRPSAWGIPLVQVARRNHRQHDTMERCQLLLKAGADVNASIERTALDSAVTNNDLGLAKLLIEAGADANASKTGMTALEVAVHKNNTDLAKLLVEAGANLNASSVRPSALQLAVSNNNLELVVLFLAKGADANHSTLTGTVLQRAANLGNLEMVKHLIDRGAGVDAKVPGSPATALQYASIHGNVEIVKYLVEHGASVNEEATASYGATAIRLAVANGHTKAAIYLIEKGASIDERPTADGETLLQLAAKHGNHEIVTHLVEKGAAVNAAPATEGGATALQFAAINGNIKMAILLLENGAHVGAKGAEVDGRTALQGAVEHGRLDMVYLLLDNDKEPDTIEERCRNAAEFAEAEHHDVIARILRDYRRP
ncbi:ankyrin protein [Fusarium phyllophilum]|uniref:Ankyrin protein n=1 Tax=Fusarium phyllophilum TaxID=47803 RepID=A0A8H5KFX1_9HYPO|nr:ankyrin protein [Fusarium phyllophilum]